MNRYELTDVFPVHLSQRVTRLSYDRRNFRSIQASQIRVFVSCMTRSEKIYFERRQFKEKYVSHVPFVAKCSRQCLEVRPDDIAWGQVATRLRRPVSDTQRKNMDLRVGYMIGENSYLVKAHFTFGQKTVAPGTVHVYQLLEVPLLFFAMDKTKKPMPIVDRCFPYNDMHLYDRGILLPNCCYRIPAGTTYLIFSTQKNFFRVDVVREDAPLPFETKDPVRCRETLADLYPSYLDEPVPTPFIGAVEERYDGEVAGPSHRREEQQQQQQQASQIAVAESVVGQPTFDWVFLQPQQQQQQDHQQQQQFVPFMEPVYFQQVVQTQQQQQTEDSMPEVDASLPEEPRQPPLKKRRREEGEEEDIVLVKEQRRQVLFTGTPPSILERNVVVASPEFIERYQALKNDAACNVDPRAPADPEMIVGYETPQQEEPLDMRLNESDQFDRLMDNLLKECKSSKEKADGVIEELFSEDASVLSEEQQ